MAHFYKTAMCGRCGCTIRKTYLPPSWVIRNVLQFHMNIYRFGYL